jgi:F0F1-type ATP synthase alpha subunit
VRNPAELTDVIKSHLADGARLGSDLDHATQVAILFAGAQGLLDDVPVDAVRPFETFFHDWLERTEPGLLKAIRDTGALSDDLRDALTRAVQDAKRELARAPGVDADPDGHAEDGGEG